MTISELSALTQIPSDTIRYYEKFGLISEIERTESGYRQYLEKHVHLLAFITKCKNMGYTLNEIKTFLSDDIFQVTQQYYMEYDSIRDEDVQKLKTLVNNKTAALKEEIRLIEEKLKLVQQFGQRLEADHPTISTSCPLKKALWS